MWKLNVFAVAVVLAAALAVASAAMAEGGGDVVKRGSCSGASQWKLKLSRDNGRIETEFEVDQNVAGRKWRVVLRENGVRRFSRVRTTKAPSGSFTVRRLLPNPPGTDRIVARARSLASGEICRGAARI